jgi:hypothetical protein
MSGYQGSLSGSSRRSFLKTLAASCPALLGPGGIACAAEAVQQYNSSQQVRHQAETQAPAPLRNVNDEPLPT